MLHLETVEPATLGLLKNLMQLPALKNFDLVGGTALALQIGHRKSVDIDLFTSENFSAETLLSLLKKSFNVKPNIVQNNTLLCLIDEIKVDFVKFSEPNLELLVIEETIRMKSIKDIACMKFAALLGRSTKKDYYDIYFLLQQFTLQEMLEWFKQKTKQTTVIHIIRSMGYFDEAETTPTPELLIPVEWSEVKRIISLQAGEYLQ